MSNNFDLREINNIAKAVNLALLNISSAGTSSGRGSSRGDDSGASSGPTGLAEGLDLDGPEFDDITIRSPGAGFNPDLNLPLILKVDPNFALFQFGKRLLLKLNAFRMYLELKHHDDVLPNLEEIISRGSKVLTDYAGLSRNTPDTEDELKRYFEVPSAEILSKLDEVFSQLNLQEKDLLSAKIKPDLTFEDKKAANKVLKIVQAACVNSLKSNGHNPPPFTQLEAFSFLSYPEIISNRYSLEVDFTQLAARDRIWGPILQNIISNKNQVSSLSSHDKASLRLSLFLNKLDSVLGNPSNYLRPHPFYLHWAALSADEVVESGGVYSFSCKSGKDRTGMAVEVRAVHFAIKAVEKVFDEFKSGHKSNSDLIKAVRERLEKLKVEIIHKKVTDLTPLQIQEFHNVYASSFSPKPQWYARMHPDLQRLLDQILAKCFVQEGKVLDLSSPQDYKTIKQSLDKHLGWDSPLGQYLPIATNLFRVDFKASLDGKVILSETAFRHGALVKNEMMGDSSEIQRVSDLIYGQITNAMLGAVSSKERNSEKVRELRLIALLTPLKILNPAKDDNKDFLKHLRESIERMIKIFPHHKTNFENLLSIFNRGRHLNCKLTRSVVPVDTGFASLQDARMVRDHCSLDSDFRVGDLINSAPYDLQDMVSFLIYNELFEDNLGGDFPFENTSHLLKDFSSSVLASGVGDLVAALLGAGIKDRLKRGGLCQAANVDIENELKQVAKQVKQDSGGKFKPQLLRRLVQYLFSGGKDAGFSDSIPLFSPLLLEPARELLNDVLNEAFVKSGDISSFGAFEIKPGQSEFSVNQIALIKLIAPNLKSVISGARGEPELLEFISWVQGIEKAGFCFLKQAEPERCASPLFFSEGQQAIEYFWDINPDVLKDLRELVQKILGRKPKCYERSLLGGYFHDLTQHLYKLKDEGVYAGVKFSDLQELGACLILEAHFSKDSDSLSEGGKLLYYRSSSDEGANSLDRIKALIHPRPQLQKGFYLPINLKSIPWFLSLLISSSLSCGKALVCLPLACLKAPMISSNKPGVLYEQLCDREDVNAMFQKLKSCAGLLGRGLNFVLLRPLNIGATGFLNIVFNGPLFLCSLLKAAAMCEMLEFLSDVKKQSHRYIRSYPDVVLIALFDFICFMQSDLEVLRMFKDDKPRYNYSLYALSLLVAMPAIYYLLKTMCWDQNHISSKLDRIIKSDSFDSKGATVFRQADVSDDMDVKIDIEDGISESALGHGISESALGHGIKTDGQRPLLSVDAPQIYI